MTCFPSLFVFQQGEFYCDPVELNGKDGGVAVVRGHRVDKLDIVDRKAELDDGCTITYDKCFIATGKHSLFTSLIIFL